MFLADGWPLSTTCRKLKGLNVVGYIMHAVYKGYGSGLLPLGCCPCYDSVEVVGIAGRQDPQPEDGSLANALARCA